METKQQLSPLSPTLFFAAGSCSQNQGNTAGDKLRNDGDYKTLEFQYLFFFFFAKHQTFSPLAASVDRQIWDPTPSEWKELRSQSVHCFLEMTTVQNTKIHPLPRLRLVKARFTDPSWRATGHQNTRTPKHQNTRTPGHRQMLIRAKAILQILIWVVITVSGQLSVQMQSVAHS